MGLLGELEAEREATESGDPFGEVVVAPAQQDLCMGAAPVQSFSNVFL